MKTRLIIATGFYSILNNVATIETINNKNSFYDVLVIQLDNQNSLDLENFAKSLFKFDKIILININDSKKHKNIKDISLKTDELYIPYFSWIKKLAKYYTYKTKIFIVEEGTSTYINHLKIYKKYKYNICTYLLHPSLLTLHQTGEIKIIDHNIFKKVLNRINNKEPKNFKEPFILFISSSYNYMEKKRDHTAYINVINQLIETYNIPVFFKPHPRDNVSDFNVIKEGIINNDMLVLLTNKDFIISEIIFPNPNLKFCVTDFSSSILNSYYIFNKPSFCFLSNNAIVKNEFELFIKFKFPNIIDFLNQNFNLSEYDYSQLYNAITNKTSNILDISALAKIHNEYIFSKKYKKTKFKLIIIILLLLILLITLFLKSYFFN